MSCKVKYCRFSDFHTTKSHQCGWCGKFGHGQMECGNTELTHDLQQHFHEELPEDKWCEFDYCEHRKYHTTQSHYCKFCKKSHRTINDCIYKDLEETQRFLHNEYDLESKFANDDNFYVVNYVGMGNILVIRKKAGTIQSMYMGQSVWGQYGDTPEMNHTPLYNNFIEGLAGMGPFHHGFGIDNNQNQIQNQIQNQNQNQSQNQSHNSQLERTVKCPLCRTKNNIKDIITIKGLTETCKVCLVNEIEKCFPACNHACVCASCLESL